MILFVTLFCHYALGGSSYKKTTKENCHFPFTAHNQTYTDCVSINSARPLVDNDSDLPNEEVSWCATTVENTTGTITDWAYCLRPTRCNETFLDVKWSRNPYAANGWDKYCYSQHIDSNMSFTSANAKFMEPVAKNWFEARNNCLALGGDLLSVENIIEYLYLAEFQHEVSTSGIQGAMWLGLNDQVSQSQEKFS